MVRNNLIEGKNEFIEEIQGLTEKAISSLEEESFTVKGKRLNEVASLINEKIKIYEISYQYILEKCERRHVSTLRQITDKFLNYIDMSIEKEEYEIAKRLIVIFDLMFGIDISYYVTLKKLYENGLLEEICDYIINEIDNGISFDKLYEKTTKEYDHGSKRR